MTNRTFWDEEFKELNSIELSENQKAKLWKNISVKKQNRLGTIKYGLILSAAAALFLFLASSFISGKIHTKNHSASSPPKQTKIEPAQFLSSSDSAEWELIARERYDLAIIEKIETSQNQVSITVKRINSFGSDADPLGQIMKPDTDTRDYILKSSQPKQTLHLKAKQTVLLSFGQYSKKGSTEWFWAAEVVGNSQNGDILYNSVGDPINLKISSKVNIADGFIKIEE